jgi:cytochrome P450
MALPKSTNHEAQILHVGNQVVTVPPNVGVSPSVLGIQTHPKYWNEPLIWRPSRWIVKSTGSSTGDETLFIPPRCTYFPWSEGPQNCPGTKFSQVEFVAVLACLLRDHRICGRHYARENLETARTEIMNIVNDVNMQMLLRMQNADRARLMCIRV